MSMTRTPLTVCWLSAGVSSFIAGWLYRDKIDRYIYIDIADQHPDSIRFIRDCEVALGKPVEILRSDEYRSVEDCIRHLGYIRMVHSGFAPCTAWLKKAVRKKWECQQTEYDITYVWGMDVEEKRRAQNIEETMIEFHHVFPLIEKNLTKQDCHALLERLGIKRPSMYDMGYNNNNCIGCIKGGMGYWNKIRVDFPEVFESRAKLEREIGSRCLKECYLDELPPERGRMEDEISTECSVMCYLAENGLED